MQFLSQTNPEQKRVLLRLDLDLPQDDNGQFDTTRMEVGIASIEYLWQHKASSVTVIAHRGHHAEPSPEFSLQPIAELLFESLLQRPAFSGATNKELRGWLTVRENLRFDVREEEGSLDFAKELGTDHDLFVNDAFATAHRKHTSIVIIPKVLPSVLGMQFEKEFHAFEHVFHEPTRPMLFILGGSKLETKLPLLEEMAKIVDKILVGGKLAVEAKQGTLTYSELLKSKMQIAEITEDTLDISKAAADRFEMIIGTAKTIIWNGPMGYFEDGEHAAGTQTVGEAVADATHTGAFSVIGGGDTEAALTVLDLEKPGNFSHISSAGGAMMHYLAHRSLPAIEALK
jgi:3-phosphoglycerate kinase